ncbi:MAG: hypothetical protein RL763_1303 [Pseudomonadota bacterium]
MTIQSQPQRSKTAQLSVWLTAACMSFAAWSQDAPQDGVYKDRIDWGLLMDMSGPTSASQGIWVNGFRDYMRRVNEGGGVFGRKINVLAEDNRFNPATDKIAYEKLVSQTPVIAISGMGMSASPSRQARYLLWVPTQPPRLCLNPSRPWSTTVFAATSPWRKREWAITLTCSNLKPPKW